MLLKNKTAVITGCNKGIGKKILEIFSMNGADIVACVRTIDSEFEKFIKELSKKFNNKITPINFDLSKEDETKDAASKIIAQNKKIDILINNAAIIQTSLYQMTSSKNLKDIFQVNFFSQTIFTQLIIKSMIKNKNGRILFISSTSGLDADIGRSAYSSTKAAIISQCKVLSKELGNFNIRVNSIAPGLTDTDMMRKNTKKEVIDEVISRLSLKRVGQTEEIANVALFLSSDLSSYVTGQTIRVDGGM